MRRILAINGGSSSVKVALYDWRDPLTRQLEARIDRIGSPGTTIAWTDSVRHVQAHRDLGPLDGPAAAEVLIDWLDAQVGLTALDGIGHRIVNGGAALRDPQRVTPALLDALRGLTALAPEHLPFELALIDGCLARVPKAPQVACFDTAFHRDMPRVAKLLPLPRRLLAQGVERYGFHGLSCAYLMEELERVAGPEAARGRVILAHLGNGSSLTAVRHGASMDTSMAFTPAAGVPMSTRSGDLDPGLVWYLARTEGMTAEQFHHMVNHESGLFGVSDGHADLRDLLDREPRDVASAEAVALFCYHVKKTIGAYTAVLGGLDTLIFAGGIGENAQVIRRRVCEGLGFLGVDVDEARNAASAPLISRDGSPVAVRVIRTDEELMIARAVARLLG